MQTCFDVVIYSPLKASLAACTSLFLPGAPCAASKPSKLLYSYLSTKLYVAPLFHAYPKRSLRTALAISLYSSPFRTHTLFSYNRNKRFLSLPYLSCKSYKRHLHENFAFQLLSFSSSLIYTDPTHFHLFELPYQRFSFMSHIYSRSPSRFASVLLHHISCCVQPPNTATVRILSHCDSV